MQRMRIPVLIEIVVEGELDVKRVDEAIHQAWQGFGSAAWQAVAEAVEHHAEAQYDGDLLRKGREVRQLWTGVGWVQFLRQRYRYRGCREPGSFLLFDKRCGLNRYSRCTPAASELFAKISALAPSFAQARALFSLITGDAPSSWSLWKRTQEEGARLRREDRMLCREIFEQGDLPGAEGPQKSVVVVEADSTRVHKWKEKGANHEVFVGIAYTGKERVGKSGKRRRLTGKVAACGVGSASVFGQDLFAAAQTGHNVVFAERVIFASDGDSALEAICRRHFYRATHQMDQNHVSRRVTQAYGMLLVEDVKEMNRCIFSEDRQGFEAKWRLDRKRYPERQVQLDEMHTYVAGHWDQIFAVRRLKRQDPNRPLPPHLNGTGAEERHMATVVGHRMKRRGMGWGKKGAANMMRVRIKALGLEPSDLAA